MQRLGATQHCGQGLKGDTGDIVLWLLCSQGTACSLGMETDPSGALILRVLSSFHLSSPDTSSGTLLGKLIKKVIVGIEEEAQPGSTIIHLQASLYPGLNIGLQERHLIAT